MKRLLFFLIFSQAYSLIITEVFTGNGDFFDREEKYIEIFNNSEEIIKIQNIEIRIFTNENSFIKMGVKTSGFKVDLPYVLSKDEIGPFETAVVISPKYTNHLELLPFASNCIILNSSSETAWLSSWHSRISNILIYYNGIKMFETGQIALREENFKSFSFDGEQFITTGLSPGYPATMYISSSNLIGKREDLISIYGVTEGSEKIIVRTSKSLYYEEINVKENFNFFWRVPALINGENIVFESSGKRLVIRYVDFSAKSDYWGKVFINEIVGDPKKDYSGGNWTGEDSGGTINYTDDWVELLNNSFDLVDTDKIFFLEKKVNVKKLIVRTNATYSDKKFLGKGFLITTPDGGLSLKGDLYLFEGHPFKGGRVIDYIDYSEIGLKATSYDDESLSVLIQANSELPKEKIIKKTKTSYLDDNSPETGFIFYNFQNSELEIFVADKSITYDQLIVKLKNSFDEEDLVLVKTNFYFYSKIAVKENSEKFDGVLSTGKGSYTEISYTNLFSGNLVKEIFKYVSPGWNLPDFSEQIVDFVIYPNPISSGNRKIRITSFPEGAEIYLVDNRGNILKNAVGKEKFIEWEENFGRGFYLVAVHFKGKKYVKKLFVY